MARVSIDYSTRSSPISKGHQPPETLAMVVGETSARMNMHRPQQSTHTSTGAVLTFVHLYTQYQSPSNVKAKRYEETAAQTRQLFNAYRPVYRVPGRPPRTLGLHE